MKSASLAAKAAGMVSAEMKVKASGFWVARVATARAGAPLGAVRVRPSAPAAHRLSASRAARTRAMSFFIG